MREKCDIKAVSKMRHKIAIDTGNKCDEGTLCTVRGNAGNNGVNGACMLSTILLPEAVKPAAPPSPHGPL